ncbi:hypothetical protein HMPREF9057_01536 [Actinomyces sp. oral taxon 171 str. F0337]|nr:hypothetical protein HMPREF9057_01536 [Actinomyces sp. oral taxon 171 str. F0337]EGV14126.1 hypothetical protein HMPREF9058_1763 [Actinomyces sp. oral taxon 175 str. F0384]
MPTPWGPNRPGSPDVVENPTQTHLTEQDPSQLWKIRKNAHG